VVEVLSLVEELEVDYVLLVVEVKVGGLHCFVCLGNTACLQVGGS